MSSLIKCVCNHSQTIAPKQMPAKAIIVRRTVNESRTTGTDAVRAEELCDVAEVEAADDDPDADEVLEGDD